MLFRSDTSSPVEVPTPSGWFTTQTRCKVHHENDHDVVFRRDWCTLVRVGVVDSGVVDPDPDQGFICTRIVWIEMCLGRPLTIALDHRPPLAWGKPLLFTSVSTYVHVSLAPLYHVIYTWPFKTPFADGIGYRSSRAALRSLRRAERGENEGCDLSTSDCGLQDMALRGVEACEMPKVGEAQAVGGTGR